MTLKYLCLFLIITVFLGCKNKPARNSSPQSISEASIQKKENVIQEKESDKLISYWDTQRKGANYFNETPTYEWFASAAVANIRLIRFTYEKWKGEEKDFLLGNADNYQGIVEKDFELLKKYLDIAADLDIKIVLTPLSLPGARYTQSNNGKMDGRLWSEKEYLTQAMQFWKDLAVKLKDHPAVVAYNLINEPFPERFHGKPTFWGGKFKEWYATVKGQAGDLNCFNKEMVGAIRSINPDIPIVIESGLYATPWAFEYLEPIDDDKIIYSFHMYEPYEYTTKKLNQGRYPYPGKIKVEDPGGIFEMNKISLDEFLSPVKSWAELNDIPSNRIWAGEFGCDRTMPGATQYLSDLIDIFNTQDWHWAFYSYREDNWTSMDYELGTGRFFWKYWDYEGAGTLHEHYDEIYSKSDPTLWNIFAREFQADPK